MERKYNLEERLINFSVMALQVVSKLPHDIGAKNLGNQLSRSCTSPALNYGEAQAAESDRDFIHKLKVCLKELRETQVCLKIIMRVPYLNEDILAVPLKEVGELVAIFQKSINTKAVNMRKKGLLEGKM